MGAYFLSEYFQNIVYTVKSMISGMSLTFEHFINKKKYVSTLQYPNEKWAQPDRFIGFDHSEYNEIRSRLHVDIDDCIGCLQCEKACPVDCIKIDTIKPPKGSDFDCGKTFHTFDEKKVLNEYKQIEFYDHQGSHWAPHLIHKSLWNKIGGFSQEFNPGFASDTDLNMKLWKEGVRIFKGINKSRVYHFGSISIRKRSNLKKNKGNRTFLIKWGISSDLFIKHYLKSNTPYNGPLLDKPTMNITFILLFFFSKIKSFFLKILFIK